MIFVPAVVDLLDYVNTASLFHSSNQLLEKVGISTAALQTVAFCTTTIATHRADSDEGLVTVFSSDSASCGDAVKESRGVDD